MVRYAIACFCFLLSQFSAHLMLLLDARCSCCCHLTTKFFPVPLYALIRHDFLSNVFLLSFACSLNFSNQHLESVESLSVWKWHNIKARLEEWDCWLQRLKNLIYIFYPFLHPLMYACPKRFRASKCTNCESEFF